MMALGGFFFILSEFGRDEGPEGRGGAAAANGGRDAVGSGRGAAPDAIDASTSSETTRRPWRQLAEVQRRRGAPRAPRAPRSGIPS